MICPVCKKQVPVNQKSKKRGGVANYRPHNNAKGDLCAGSGKRVER